MFLKDLNANQQKLFLGLAKELIEADKKITDHEIAMIASLSGEMGQPEMICNPSDEVLEAFFPDRISRVAVMLEPPQKGFRHEGKRSQRLPQMGTKAV
jgi:hypothetical protein